jgi:hypothetical protein
MLQMAERHYEMAFQPHSRKQYQALDQYNIEGKAHDVAVRSEAAGNLFAGYLAVAIVLLVVGGAFAYAVATGMLHIFGI